MKKLLAAAGIGAAIAIGSLTGAGTASADQRRTYFLDQLNVSHGIDDLGLQPGDVAKAGYIVLCSTRCTTAPAMT